MKSDAQKFIFTLASFLGEVLVTDSLGSNHGDNDWSIASTFRGVSFSIHVDRRLRVSCDSILWARERQRSYLAVSETVAAGCEFSLVDLIVTRSSGGVVGEAFDSLVLEYFQPLGMIRTVSG